MATRQGPPSAETFRKILQLEEKRGFDNKAVAGGLDRFLERNRKELIEGIDPSTTSEYGLRSGLASLGPRPIDVGALLGERYGEMEVGRRREWVGLWLGVLGEGDSQPPLSPFSRVQEKGKRKINTPHHPLTPSSPSKEKRGDQMGTPHLSTPPERRHWISAEAGGKGEATSPLQNQKGPKKPPKLTPKKPSGGGPMLPLDSPVTKLARVEARTAAKLERLGVSTIKDLLYLFPRRHKDYSNTIKIAEMVPGQEATIKATVWEARVVRLGQQGRLQATEATVGDETGNLKVMWYGQPFIARTLRSGEQVGLSGKLDIFGGDRILRSPDYELMRAGIEMIHAGRLVPVYPLTEGLSARQMRRLVWQAIERWAPAIEDFMPQDVLQRQGLWDLPTAVMQAHFPDDLESYEEARRRLAFDELFLLQLAVQLRRHTWQKGTKGIPIQPDGKVIASFIRNLPFTLTNAQKRCLEEALGDMARGTPSMSRLLQGEVGSGKTVVALSALLASVACGYQGSIMAPTEILAEQHFQTVSKLMGNMARPVQEENLITAYLEPYSQPISVALVTGGTKKSVKREIQQRAAEGKLDIIIGTHALIQEEMSMPNLALAVVDEQHRFGVMQRAALRGKGDTTPHLLVMSATPIPRTLALTLYGDLDISTIDELPPGRQRIGTRWVSPDKRAAAYNFVREQAQAGRQAFVICPLIEESEAVEAKAATAEYKRLSTEVFPDLRLGLLHGRMPSKEKEKVMSQFYARELDILVSTPVVEVGIDVPNATVMMVEAADRFGLAQLHQFRGRVGRGEHRSYCLLLSDAPSEGARERLSAIEQIHDGFRLAEVDLQLRGPGDIFGTRQSGLPNLRMTRLSDQRLLVTAREEASRLLEKDTELSKREHGELKKEVAGRFQGEVTGEVG